MYIFIFLHAWSSAQPVPFSKHTLISFHVEQQDPSATITWMLCPPVRLTAADSTFRHSFTLKFLAATPGSFIVLFIDRLVFLIVFCRFTKDSPRFKDELEIMKYICKDFWTAVYKKQIDNLRTNHQVKLMTHPVFNLANL